MTLEFETIENCEEYMYKFGINPSEVEVRKDFDTDRIVMIMKER